MNADTSGERLTDEEIAEALELCEQALPGPDDWCFYCGHVLRGHDEYTETIMRHDRHPFIQRPKLGNAAVVAQNRLPSLAREVQTWRAVTKGLAEAIREAISEVRSWPNGPAETRKRARYDAELDALLERAKALEGP